MAEIFCATNGLTGMVLASLEAAARLRDDGHRVCYASPVDVAERAAQRDLPFLKLLPVAFDPSPQLTPGGSRIGHKLRELRSAGERQAAGVAALGMNEFLAALEARSPDLVLLDMELHEHIIAAVTAGHRTALLSPWFSVWRRPGLPPLQEATIPGVGWRGSRSALALAWWRRRWRRFWAIQRTRLRYVGTDRRAVLHRFARERGFPRRELLELDWDTIFTYRSLPVLTMTASELEFDHDRRPELHYVGPMVDLQRETRRPDPERDALAQRLRAARDHGRRVLYAPATTMAGGDLGFLRRLVAAIATRPDWLLVLGLGGQEPTNLGTGLPDNILALRHAPQLTALEHADLSIHHGGIHAIHESLAHGVPMLIYSGGRFDQNGCAARVIHRGLGRLGDRGGDDGPAILARIASLLDDTAVRERVTAMGATLRHYRDDRTLERTVAGLLTA